jgi:hypothetical protein
VPRVRPLAAGIAAIALGLAALAPEALALDPETSQRRVPLAVLLLELADAADTHAGLALLAPQPRAREAAQRGHRVGEIVQLRLLPAPVRPPAPPGHRLGHTDLVVALPVRAGLSLRTGVRVDYESGSGGDALDADPKPTLGLGLEF